jgi:hypothetical protein
VLDKASNVTVKQRVERGPAFDIEVTVRVTEPEKEN